MSRATEHHVVIGLGLGDEGKGATVDHLVRHVPAPVTNVRFNGGPQAAHHVVTPGGRTHCFAQFGSGTLVPGTVTAFAPTALVDLQALVREERVLRSIGVTDAFSRLTLDPRCLLVTPIHRGIGRLRELARGAGRHGSCGMGVGETLAAARRFPASALRVGDLGSPTEARWKLRMLQSQHVDIAEALAAQADDAAAARAIVEDITRPELVEELLVSYIDTAYTSDLHVTHIEDVLAASPRCVFEGAQGALLDPVYGFTPFVTKTRTTMEHALALLNGQRATHVGVLRSYATRHGAGPLVSEDPELTRRLPEAHNHDNDWQGAMRVGWFDLVAARYALRVAGPIDAVALTHLDRLSGLPEVRVCTAYVASAPPSAAIAPMLRWHEDGGVVTVTDLLPAPSDARHDPAALTAFLTSCRPACMTLAGWEEDLSDARSLADLPAAARSYVELLRSPHGLGRPVTLLSVGPRADQRFTLTLP